MNADAAGSRASLAFVALLAGAAAISLAPILVRLSDVSPVASAFWRVALAAPVLWAWMLIKAGPARPAAANRLISARTHGPALFAGLFFACDLGVWHVAITWTTVANATLEANFAPLFVTLGAWLLWRQRPSGLFLLALLLTLGGAALLIGPNVQASGPAFKGDLLGLLTAVFYAGYMLSIKLGAPLGTARLMAISTGITALALLPFALAGTDVFLPQSAYGWGVLAAMALIAQVAGQSLIAYAFAHLPAAMSSVSLVLQPVLAAVFAWILLGESMTTLQMAGGVVVLIGIVLAKRYG